MENSPVEQVKGRMIGYFGKDLRRINHALKVHSLAAHIGSMEGLPDAELILLETAALLHDIGIKEAELRYQSAAARYQEELGPGVALELLADMELPAGFRERLAFLIGHHHSYARIDGLDFQILVEADFLVNIFEDGMEPPAVRSIREKYFRTRTGAALCDAMFGNA
jgi:hypothetical protein